MNRKIYITASVEELMNVCIPEAEAKWIVKKFIHDSTDNCGLVVIKSNPRGAEPDRHWSIPSSYYEVL